MKRSVSVYHAGGVAYHAFTCRGRCKSCDFRFQCYTNRELVLDGNEAYELFRWGRGGILGFNLIHQWEEVLVKAEYRWNDLSPIDVPRGFGGM